MPVYEKAPPNTVASQNVKVALGATNIESEFSLCKSAVNIMYTCDLWQGHRPQNDLDFTKHVLAFKHGDIWAMANNFW